MSFNSCLSQSAFVRRRVISLSLVPELIVSDPNIQVGLFTYLSNQSSDPVLCFVVMSSSTFGDNSPAHEQKVLLKYLMIEEPSQVYTSDVSQHREVISMYLPRSLEVQH